MVNLQIHRGIWTIVIPHAFPPPPVLRTMFPYTASRCVLITSQQRRASKLCYPKMTAISLDMYTKSHLKTRDQKVVLWVKNIQLQKRRPKSVFDTGVWKKLVPLCIVSLVLSDNKIRVSLTEKKKRNKRKKKNKPNTQEQPNQSIQNL